MEAHLEDCMDSEEQNEEDDEAAQQYDQPAEHNINCIYSEYVKQLTLLYLTGLGAKSIHPECRRAHLIGKSIR